MSRAPDLSIILPVRNSAGTIRRALRSVFDQGLDHLEVIVVDDGSTDDLREALAPWRGRLRYLRRDNDHSAAGARNLGIRESAGRCIAFLDSDDEWLSGKLAQQLEHMQTSGSPWLCGSGFELFRGPGDVRCRVPQSDIVDRQALAAGCGFSLGCTLVAQRECFDVVGGFDEGLSRLEDWDWLLRAVEHYPISVIRKPLARVYQNRPPPLNDVLLSVNRLGEKHRSRLAKDSWLAGRKFAAALSIERAATSFHHRRHLVAAAYLAASFFYYPIRSVGYVGQMLRGYRYYSRRKSSVSVRTGESERVADVNPR